MFQPSEPKRISSGQIGRANRVLMGVGRIAEKLIKREGAPGKISVKEMSDSKRVAVCCFRVRDETLTELPGGKLTSVSFVEEVA